MTEIVPAFKRGRLAFVPSRLISNRFAGCGGYLADTGYYMCYPEAQGHLVPLMHFKTWLLP